MLAETERATCLQHEAGRDDGVSRFTLLCRLSAGKLRALACGFVDLVRTDTLPGLVTLDECIGRRGGGILPFKIGNPRAATWGVDAGLFS